MNGLGSDEYKTSFGPEDQNQNRKIKRDYSLSSLFIRRSDTEVGLVDKWKTIGQYGVRLSNQDLNTLLSGAQTISDQKENENNLDIKIGHSLSQDSLSIDYSASNDIDISVDYAYLNSDFDNNHSTHSRLPPLVYNNNNDPQVIEPYSPSYTSKEVLSPSLSKYYKHGHYSSKGLLMHNENNKNTQVSSRLSNEIELRETDERNRSRSTSSISSDGYNNYDDTLISNILPHINMNDMLPNIDSVNNMFSNISIKNMNELLPNMNEYLEKVPFVNMFHERNHIAPSIDPYSRRNKSRPNEQRIRKRDILYGWYTRGKYKLRYRISQLDHFFLSTTGNFFCRMMASGFPELEAPRFNVHFEKDLRMVLQDGTSLSFMMLQPIPAVREGAKFPTILVRNPYSRISFYYNFHLFAERGFNVIVMDVRGRGESEGVFDCLYDYDDSQETLIWLQTQPWFDPKLGVALLGLSYNGFVAFSTLKNNSHQYISNPLYNRALQETMSKRKQTSKGQYIVKPPPVIPSTIVRCIVPINSTSRLSTIQWRDEALGLELVTRWCGYLSCLTRGTHSIISTVYQLYKGLVYLGYCGIAEDPAFVKGISNVFVVYILKCVNKGRGVKRFYEMLYPGDSEFSKARSAENALTGTMVPMQNHGSWYDIFLKDSIHDFATVYNKGNRQARLMISRDFHISRYANYAGVIQPAINHIRRFCRDPQSIICYDEATESSDRVQVEVLMSDRDTATQKETLYFPSWPPKGDHIKSVRLSLSATEDRDGKLSCTTSGNLEASYFQNEDKVNQRIFVKLKNKIKNLFGHSNGIKENVMKDKLLIYDPLSPVKTVGGTGIGFLTAGPQNQYSVEHLSDETSLLTYTSPVLSKDMVVVGYPILNVKIKCVSPGALNGDFIARLCDVSPSGKSINICDGHARAVFEDCQVEGQNGEENVFLVKIEIYPTACRFKKGHRLRLHLTTSSFPRWERNLWCYGYHSVIPVRYQVLHNMLPLSGETEEKKVIESTYLELPVLNE